MLLSALMAGYTPDAEYSGTTQADDFVLAVDISGSPATLPPAYVVVGASITGVAAALNPTSQDRTYLRTGVRSTKTSAQRTFKITGDREIGDAFQDYALGLNISFGAGAAVEVPYVWINALTGKGEKGTASIIVNNDGSGDASNKAGIDIDLKSCGGKPAAYTYAAA